MTSHTDLIKDKLNILDVVGAYVTLEKTGKTYKGKSPFTNEKTPSFFVSPEKGFFYCFSSGKGGDIFSFIQEIERVDFKDALKLLAEKAGVRLNPESLINQKEEQKEFTLIDHATKWYEIQLRKNKMVVEYLIERGLTKETIANWRIGFARDAWRDVYDYLISKKYTDKDIENTGLIVARDSGGYYDRFRSRIMFPLMDGRSRVVGFSGRIFGNDDGKGAKYINSPESVLFDKSKVLYGYHTAKHAMSKKDACILVEGQFDVLMSQQAGYEHTVAISGTGLTDSHVEMIKRFTKNILLALDSDNAGIKATRRSVLVAYRHGMNVKIILLPEGQDPADTIRNNKEKWAVSVADAKDYIDYRLELATKKDLSFEEKKKLIEEDIFEFVAFIQSAMRQDKILQKIALFLGVSIDSVRADFSHFKPKELQTMHVAELTPKEFKKQVSVQTLILLNMLYLQDQEYEIMDEKENIKNAYYDCYHTDIEDDIQNLDQLNKDIHLFVLQQELGEKKESFIINTIKDLLYQEQLRIYEKQSQMLLQKIRVAESSGDNEKTLELVKENRELRKTIETLKDQHQNI